jgi:hypothetical protein
MTARDIPTFEEFVRTLVGDDGPLPSESIPLSKLSAGDFAVLDWLDDMQSKMPPSVEAAITARWGTASLREVYDMLFTAPEKPGGQTP